MLLEEYDHDLEMKKIEYSLTEAITERVTESVTKSVTKRVTESVTKKVRGEVTDQFADSAKIGLLEIGLSEKEADEFMRKVLARMEKQMKTQEISLTQ